MEEKTKLYILSILIIIGVCVLGFRVIERIEENKQASYNEGFEKGKSECPNCNVRDYSKGYEWGQKVGYREGYREAGKDALKLVKCYQIEKPTIENCLRVFLLEDYGELPNLNPNQ